MERSQLRISFIHATRPCASCGYLEIQTLFLSDATTSKHLESARHSRLLHSPHVHDNTNKKCKRRARPTERPHATRQLWSPLAADARFEISTVDQISLQINKLFYILISIRHGRESTAVSNYPKIQINAV